LLLDKEVEVEDDDVVEALGAVVFGSITAIADSTSRIMSSSLSVSCSLYSKSGRHFAPGAIAATG